MLKGGGPAVLCTACMYGSSGCVSDGDTPVIPAGEFQLLPVAGDVLGESSCFKLRF